MLWFHKIKIFNLKVYDKKVGEYIRFNDGYLFDSFIRMLPTLQVNFFGRIIAEDLNPIPYCIEKGYVNSKWSAFSEWYLSNHNQIKKGRSLVGVYTAPFIYRGVNPAYYRDLLKYGNSRGSLTQQYDGPNYERAGIPKSEVFFGHTSLENVWRYPKENNPSIIVVYKKRFFKRLDKDTKWGFYAWVRKDKRIDFKDTIESIIRITWRY